MLACCIFIACIVLHAAKVQHSVADLFAATLLLMVLLVHANGFARSTQRCASANTHHSMLSQDIVTDVVDSSTSYQIDVLTHAPASSPMASHLGAMSKWCGRAGAMEESYGQLRLVSELQTRNEGLPQLFAFVKWLEPMEEPLQGHLMTCFEWRQDGLPYGVVSANTLLRPLALQPNPHDEGQTFVYNHFFCCR